MSVFKSSNCLKPHIELSTVIRYAVTWAVHLNHAGRKKWMNCKLTPLKIYLGTNNFTLAPWNISFLE